MVVLFVPAGLTAAEYETTVRETVVIAFQFFFGDEMNRCVIIRKVVRHGLDLILDLCLIRSLFCHNKALSGVFFAGGQLWAAAASDCLQCTFNWDCVLSGILDALDPADRIGMSLADALAPECIIFALRQACSCIETVQGEHTRIPANGDDANLSGFLCGLIDCCEMLWNLCMGIEAVHYVKPLCIFRGLDRQIRSRTAAENQNVDLVFLRLCLIYMINRYALGQDLDRFRRTPCKYCFQFHIRILADRTLHAASQISIS